MLRIQAKRGLLKDITEGKHRIHHMVVRNAKFASIRIGDRVRLYFNAQLTCDVYVKAVRRHASLETLLNMEQWKQLTPEMDTKGRSHRLLRRQLAEYKHHAFMVLEYELLPAPSPSPPHATI
jgi:ASC-1-like (ASCH) protein